MECDQESQANMSKLERLDDGTSKALRRGQMITKISDVVRELVDNSVDARCSRVQVLLENYGINQIEVRDDGHGIPSDQFRQAITGGYTSRLQNDEILSCNEHYGFRGEALSSICSFATVDILTKTSNDRYGLRYHLDENGRVTAQSPGPISKGTHVKVTNLFAKYPVRRNYIQEKTRRSNELKEILSYIKSLALANPSIQFGLIHNRATIWTKPAVVSLDQAIIAVFGTFVGKDLTKCGPIAFTTSAGAGRKSSGTLSTIELFTPRAPVDVKLMTQATNKLTMIFVNRRRVYIQEFEKLLRAYTQAATESDSEASTGPRGYPTCVLKIQVPPDQVDFNREIDKSNIWLPCQNEIAEKLDELLHDYYKVDINVENQPRAKRLKTTDKITAMPNTVVRVPLTDRSDNVNQRGQGDGPSCTSVRSITEHVDRIVPNFESPGSSTVKRNDSDMSTPADIPIASNASGFAKRIISSLEPITVQPRIITDCSSLESSFPSVTIQSEIPSTPTPRSSVHPVVSNTSTGTSRDSRILGTNKSKSTMPSGTVVAPTVPIDEEWIHGRLKDQHGNVIESTTVFTGGMAMAAKENSRLKKRTKSPEFRVVPTTPKSTPLRESNLYTPESAREKYQNFMSKIASCHMGTSSISGTPVSLANPIRRLPRTPLFSQTPVQEQISGEQSSQQLPRPATLESLRNWKAPVCRANSYRKPPRTPLFNQMPVQEETTDGQSSQKLPRQVTLESLRNWNTPACLANPIRRPPRTPQFSQTPVQQEISGGQSSQKLARQVTLESFIKWKTPGPSFSRTNSVRASISSAEIWGIPKSASISNGSVVQECSPPAVPESVRGHLETISMQRNAFELKESVHSKIEEFLPPMPVQPQSTGALSEQTEPKTRVIAPLPGLSSTYIVAIGQMLGAFSPANFLEMEPCFKVIVGISPTSNDSEKYNLSVECVESLLQEFAGLSSDDYSEAQVRNVFHHMRDLDED